MGDWAGGGEGRWAESVKIRRGWRGGKEGGRGGEGVVKQTEEKAESTPEL